MEIKHTQKDSKEIRIYFELNKDGNTIYQSLWAAEKEVLRGKIIALNAYFRKEEMSQIHNLRFQFKKLEKEQHKSK